jgi:hypothetical protein
MAAVALADPDDPAACDQSTGLPPGLGRSDDELLLDPGVAEALLSVLKQRSEELPEGTSEARPCNRCLFQLAPHLL